MPVKKNITIQIVAAVATVLAVVTGFVAEPVFENGSQSRTSASSGISAGASVARRTVSTVPPGPYVPSPPAEPSENLNTAAAKERAVELEKLSARLDGELDAGEFENAVNTMYALVELAPSHEEKSVLERDIAECSAIAEAENLRFAGRFDKASAVLYPVAADESRGKWSEIARKLLEEINSSNAAADAMLSAASARLKIKKNGEALEILNLLVEKYPALPQAESARALIHSLDAGGK